jgi:hypothetical protein
MEFLNLHSSILDSPELVGAEPLDRATWLMLLRYCIGQENGGTIPGCRSWKDRKWQQLARVALAEVNRPTDLWTWDGEDLHVTHYPVSQELAVRTKRDIARANGRRGGRPRENPEGNPEQTDVGFPSVSKTEPTEEPTANPERKRKEREGKEREGTTPPRASEAERLVSASPRPSLTREALFEAASALTRHHGRFTFEQILEATQTATAAVRAWPDDERLTYAPTAAVFFRDDLFRRHPDDWASRREARKRLAADKLPPKIDIGKRRPTVLDTSLPAATALDFAEPDFAP